MSQAEQQVFFLKYTEKRAADLLEPVVVKKTRKSSGKKVAVTTETLEILSKLGLV
ncbi:unnamed protein product [marine sediment metagenome]|uniref:Uncharacterized protein n=1 Tax=marine sediment metagenome TaxID=412755 RepID=X1BYE6_9ZZZZ